MARLAPSALLMLMPPRGRSSLFLPPPSLRCRNAPMPLLAVSHIRQRQESDCLAACAAMMLDYLGLKYDYAKLIKALNIHAGGAAVANLRNLEQMGVQVLLEHGDMQQLTV